MSRELHSRFWCVTMTPLGAPVEPEVNMSAARSASGLTAGRVALEPPAAQVRSASRTNATFSLSDHDWSARFSWNHAVRQDGWGDNFPLTDIYTLGVSYGFR